MDKNAKTRLFLKGLVCDVFVVVLQFGGIPPAHSADISDQELLNKSQISYRAEGGFSGVESYGVIVSAVNGKISVLKSIVDPRLSHDKQQVREVSTMDAKQYVALWNKLDRCALLKMENAPQPKADIHDEFTVRFVASVGDEAHEFEVYGISRPEASRYYSLRKLIDDSVQMQAMWSTHQNVAENLDGSPLLTEKFN